MFSFPFLFLVFSLSTIDGQTRCLFLFLLLPRSLIIPSHCSSFSSSSPHFSCLSNIPVFFLIFSFSLQGSHSLTFPSCFSSSFLFLFFLLSLLSPSFCFHFVFPLSFCVLHSSCQSLFPYLLSFLSFLSLLPCVSFANLIPFFLLVCESKIFPLLLFGFLRDFSNLGHVCSFWSTFFANVTICEERRNVS